MILGERLRALREEKNLSQGEIEKKTGLLRCYISRVENGHTVPAVETLSKFAFALEVPLFRLFFDGEIPERVKAKLNGASKPEPKDSAEMTALIKLLPHIKERDQQILLRTAKLMARRAA